MQENQDRLVDYLKVAYWLVKEEIPHTTKYDRLLDLCTELDGSGRMKQWQELRPQNATYMSHNIPCEFLVAFKEHMQVFLKNQLKPFNIGVPYLSVM